MINTLALIGVGLIGGSLALDLKRGGHVREVVGIDIDADNLTRALERKVIDRADTRIDGDSIGGADMVLLATPVATLADICRRIAPHLAPQTLVSDVGSTKQSALAAFAQALPQHLPYCVAAHPIAGSDRHGATAAQFGLFAGKKCIVCPHPQQDPAAQATVSALWQTAGAHVHTMDAAEHDAVFAAVSHLPHLLAYAYVHQIGSADARETLLQFAGSGFRDFTRIAASHPAIWTDICLANRDSLQTLLQRQQQELAFLQQCLQQQDRQALADYFQAAKHTRDAWQDAQD
ncbi:prephenate dehydrogenase [Neisseria sp. HSC-16F19]|nr:prephenate dehydrogenase/arogenate dehydrogenase family protein [Neisseria sp. HSC-16F19]MCP2040977.1 prephenate dehydrogenase [Neisseria sp. HSC-16F19]